MTGKELYEYLKEHGMEHEELLIKAEGYADWCEIKKENIEDYCDVIVIAIGEDQSPENRTPHIVN